MSLLIQPEPSAAPGSVTAPHKKVYPRTVVGPLRRLRWIISTALQIVLFLGPWITWHGRQAILFDLAERRFHFFGLSFWPQELYFVLIVLVFLAITLFVSTAIAGRMWCGYACPQTLLTEMFVVVERWLEGERAAAARLDREPWHGRKIGIKSAKYAIWTCMSVWLGITFVGYLSPSRDLLVDVILGHPSPTQAGLIFLVSIYALFAFGYFREQACHYVCPYARFQGAMFDSDTLLVAYDAKRGEPRGKVKAKGAGDCVDCRLCVQACPMGIDIRDGNQFECITCTACLDACDSVMDRLQRPRGLVRYTSMNALEGKPWHLLRPRVFVYSGILLALAGLFVWLLASRDPIELSAVKRTAGQGNVFSITSDGRVANPYTLKIINKDSQSHTLALTLKDFPGAQLVISQNPVEVPADSAVDVPTLVVHARAGLPPVQPFAFHAADPANPRFQSDSRSSFIGPGL